VVEGFVGVARVLSVLAPYTCRACGEDRLRLVDLQNEAPVIAEGRAPEHSCPVCAGKLEFADLPSEFFDYAQRQQFGTVDPVVMRYLRATTPSAPSALTTHLKIVQDDITYISLEHTSLHSRSESYYFDPPPPRAAVRSRFDAYVDRVYGNVVARFGSYEVRTRD